MEKLISRLIDESIKVELNLSMLYTHFSKRFEADSVFWSQLASEEKEHARLLEIGKEMSVVTNSFPVNILSQDLEKVISTNKMIEEIIISSHSLSDRTEAGRIALRIERSSTELSFERFMNNAPENELAKIFVKLNSFDKNHAKRICDYFQFIDTGF